MKTIFNKLFTHQDLVVQIYRVTGGTMMHTKPYWSYEIQSTTLPESVKHLRLSDGPFGTRRYAIAQAKQVIDKVRAAQIKR